MRFVISTFMPWYNRALLCVNILNKFFSCANLRLLISFEWYVSTGDIVDV